MALSGKSRCQDTGELRFQQAHSSCSVGGDCIIWKQQLPQYHSPYQLRYVSCWWHQTPANCSYCFYLSLQEQTRVFWFLYFPHRLRLTDDLAIMIFTFWSASDSSVFFVARKRSTSQPSGVSWCGICLLCGTTQRERLSVGAGNGKHSSYCSWKSYCSGRLP